MSEPEKKSETWRQSTKHFQNDIGLNTTSDPDLIVRGYNFGTSSNKSTQFTFNKDAPSNPNKSNPFSFQAKPQTFLPKSHHDKKSSPFPNKLSHHLHHIRKGHKRFDNKMCVRMEEKIHYQNMIEQSSRALGNYNNNNVKHNIIAQEFMKGDDQHEGFRHDAPLRQCISKDAMYRDDKMKEDLSKDSAMKPASYKLNDHFKGSYKTSNQHDVSRDSTVNTVLYKDLIGRSESRQGLQYKPECGLKRCTNVRKDPQSRSDFRDSCLETILKSPYHSSSSQHPSSLNSPPSTIILSDTSSPNSPSQPDTLQDYNSTTSSSSFKDPRPPSSSSSLHHRMLPLSSSPPSSSSLFRPQSKPPLSYKQVISLSSTSSSPTTSLSNGLLDERYRRSVEMLAEVTGEANNHNDNNNDMYGDNDNHQQSTTFLKSQQQQQRQQQKSDEVPYFINKKQPSSFSVSNNKDTTQQPKIISVYSKDTPQHQQPVSSHNNNKMSSLIQQQRQQHQQQLRNKKHNPSVQTDQLHTTRNNVVVINHRNIDARQPSRPNNTIDLTNVDENDDPHHHHHHHKGYHVDLSHDDDDEDDDDGTDFTVTFDPEESRRYLSTYENTISTSPYCHKDFLHNIRDKGMWKERELRVKETEVQVDELRKKRSSHNTHESVINKMKNLMSITNRIAIPVKEDYIHIEDDEEDEEDDDVMIEKVETNEFPVLSREQQTNIDQVLSTPHSSKVVVEAFRYQLTHKDLSTLAGLNWLNDEVINFYMSLLVHRSEQDNKLPSIYAFNTFFYPKLLKGGQKSVRRWTKSIDIFKHSLILVPVHLGVHWCLAVMDIDRKQVRYYDSMGGGNRNMAALLTYLVDEMKDKQQKDLDTSAWETIIVKDIPQQMNGSDCGMFACKFAEYLSRNANITFDQSHMPYFRRRMIYEILTKKLL